MDNERAENIFYLDLKHVHTYGCTKFQPNPCFCSERSGTESAAEEERKKNDPPCRDDALRCRDDARDALRASPVGHLVQTVL